MAIAPSSVEERDLREPPKAPKGVRLAATMKMFVIVWLWRLVYALLRRLSKEIRF